MNKFIKIHKDVLSNKSKKNVVYQILCKDCDATYVERTENLKAESQNIGIT